MKRDFTNEDFEDFLKKSADSLRMKAPDKVWQNLSKELNRKRRRFTIGLSAFLLISSAVGYGVITNLPDAQVANSNAGPTKADENLNETTTTKNYQSSEQTFTPVISLNNTSAPTSREEQPSAGARVIPFGRNTTTPTAELNTALLNEPLTTENEFVPTIVDSYTELEEETRTEKQTTASAISENQELPYSIESVINSYKARGGKKKWETQLYFTPTISYRKLTENKSYLRSLDPAVAAASFPGLNSSVNNNVTHKPDIGFELGVAAKYAVSNKLKVRGGVQFNVNRYDVKAFSTPLTQTTIALNTAGGIDSLRAISGYSNDPMQGYKSNWLQNLSFQLSVPIGAEFIIRETDDVEFGVATTIQPTYVLGDRAYLITTDYKNYTQVPWLIRRWNVNTALETFVTLKSGKTKWQVGPQVRYQLLSSFISKYPVKENLFDFGLKVGITLNNK